MIRKRLENLEKAGGREMVECRWESEYMRRLAREMGLPEVWWQPKQMTPEEERAYMRSLADAADKGTSAD